jgi:hypothetical protein
MTTEHVIRCASCASEFLLNDEERAWYATKGWTAPRRCPSCRAARRASRAAVPTYDAAAAVREVK